MKNCLVKLNARLRDFNTSEVTDAADAYRSRGLEDKAANVRAVEDHLRDLRQQQKRLEAQVLAEWEKRDPEGFTARRPEVRLTGETETEIKSREARETRDAEGRKRRDSAPAASDFTLSGSDRAVDQARSRGQRELAPAIAADKGTAFYRTGATDAPGMTVADLRRKMADAIVRSRVPVRVVQDVADLPFEAEDDARGAYHEGVIWLVASNIPNAAIAEQTLARHEFVHAGYDLLYGGNRKARERALRDLQLKNRELRELASSWRIDNGDAFVAEAVERGFTDDEARAEMTLRSMEESVAYYAETSEGRAPLKGWQAFVAALQRGLRAMGLHRLADLLNGGDANAAIAELLRAVERPAEEGDALPEGDLQPAFARTGKEDQGRFDRAMARMDEMVSLWEKKTLKPKDATHLGDTPRALQLVGAPDMKLYISGETVEKILGWKHGHQITPDMLRQIPAQLLEPTLVFRPQDPEQRAHGGFIVVTELTDKTGHPVIVPIQVRKDMTAGRPARLIANSIASVYGYEDGIRALEAWANKGDLLYFDRSKTAAPTSTLGQPPGEAGRFVEVVQLGTAANGSIRSDADVERRWGAMFAGSRPAVAAQPVRGSDHLPAWLKDASPALQSAASKIDTFAPGKTFKEKVGELKANWKERVVQGAFDAYAPLKRLGPTEYVKARMVKSSDGALEGLLLHGKPMMSADGAIYGDLDRKGFLGAMKELRGEHDRFFMWVAGNRAERLMGEDREHLFTRDEITAMKGLNAGKMSNGSSRAQAYLAASETLRGYNRAVLDIAQKTGLIDGESRRLWEHDFYVPFFRVGDDLKIDGPSTKVKGLVRQQAFKKLKGGEEPLGDLLENTMRNWSHLLSASLANQAAVASLKAAERLGIASVVPPETKGATYAMVDGKKVSYEVRDPFILSAVSAMESASFKGLPMELMGKFKHYLTLGVTVSPTFRIRNLMRDSIAAIGQNEVSYNVMGNLARGFAGTDRKSDQYAQMLFNGALMRFGQLTDGKHAEHAKRLIADGVDETTILTGPEKTKAALGRMWDAYQEFGDRMENVNRAALYRKLKDEGKSDLEAAFAARDMLDFSLQGSWTAVRFLTQIVPFMNARLQGMYKLGRAAQQNPARLGYVSGAVALASIALLLAYGDDDEWKKREDWDRDNFWWFRIGDTAYRIPKPFEIGAIGTLAERSVELMISDEMTGKRFAERMRHMVGDTFALNPVPQLFKPMIDLYANEDSFSGRQIETRGMENLSKSERMTPFTSLVAKIIGKAGGVTGISPVQADHLIRAYFGWLGSHAAMTVDMVAQPFMDTQKPASKLDDYLVVGDFAKSLPSSRSRYVEEFYKQAKVVHEVMGDLKQAREAHDVERVQEILLERRSELGMAKLYRSAERRMGEISREIRLVRAGPLSSEAKRTRLDVLELRRAELARLVEQRAMRARAAADRAAGP